MSLAITVAIQVAIMFIIIVLGFIIRKKGMITPEGSKQISDILLIIVTPCVLIKAYQVDFQTDLVHNLLIAFASATLINVMAMIVSGFIFGRKKDEKSIINRYCSAYSNCGFMGIPLLEATLGSQGVFYGAAYLAVFNVFNWTQGIYMYTQDKKSLSVKNILINPGVGGVIAGLIFFFARVHLPAVIYTAVDYMAGLNTPLAMLMLGIFLADVKLGDAIKNKNLYLVSFVRLMLIPMIAILMLKNHFVPSEVAVAVIIPAACPCATAAALFAAKYDLDVGYASEIVSINTLISIITIPIIVAVNSLVPVLF